MIIMVVTLNVNRIIKNKGHIPLKNRDVNYPGFDGHQK